MFTDLLSSVIESDSFGTVTGTETSGTVTETGSLEYYSTLDFERVSKFH